MIEIQDYLSYLFIHERLWFQENVEHLIQELRRPKYSVYFICECQQYIRRHTASVFLSFIWVYICVIKGGQKMHIWPVYGFILCRFQ